MRLPLSVILLLSWPAAASAQICTEDDDCSGDDACIAGLCIAPVDDLEAYATAASARPSSYLRALQIPALFEPDPEECCFDLDGDTTIDDAFGSLLAIEAQITGADVQGLLEEAILDLTLVRVFDWTELPAGLAEGNARFSVFGAFAEDGATQPDLAAGSGSVILDHETFGAYGAIDQFNTGQITSSVFTGSGSSFSFVLPVGALQFELALRNPVVEIPLEESVGGGCVGLCTVDEDRPGDEPPVVGGGKLGGLVAADDYLTGYDAFFRTCACSVVDPGEPVFFFGEGPTSYQVSCNDDNIIEPDTCGAGDPCGQLSTICGTIGIVAATLDADQDGSGVDDSWTAGFRFSLSGTQINGVTVPPEIFFDDFESGDTSAWTVVPD